MAEEDRVFANEARYPERKQAGAFRQVISRTFQAFRYRDFRLMWFGAFTSTTGTWMQQVAEAWVVLELTGSAFYLGLTRFLGELPILLFTLVAGVTADRVDRRWQLLASQYTQMTCAFILATLVVLDQIQIWHFLLLAFVVGTGQSFGGPAYQALVPGLVQKKDLANAIALNSIQFNLARVVGPLLAGAALATLGAALCFLFNGISFVAVIISLYLIRATFRPPKTGESVLTGLRQGLAFVKNQGALWQLSVLGFASTFCGIPLLVLLPIFARDVFAIGATGYSTMLACSGVGSISGALVYAGLTRLKNRGLFILRVQLGFALLILLFSASGSLILSYIILFFAGASLISLFASVTSLVQTVTSEEMRGRVMSIFMLAFRGGMPLGSLVAGYLASEASPSVALAVMGALLSLIATGFLLSNAGVKKL